ncbi:histidine phosphatase family protein [Microbacterium paraoxydans]|uniref:Histidine phosphatase family protein n=1 Tax=Microbacterium paraoxydans TaxID=199592 RepID=A0ABS5IJM4_9MICO|nr:histidine phosphatase family protein [Microbacterium paraoxydans]MBS0023167.1 histidine phosphatase family protein [Microbacterium paraoxydans]
MTASRLHLVRHGEVHNPARVLYGRLPDYHLSRAGRGMAASAAAHVAQLGDPVAALYASPLERAQESAEPFAERFDLVPEIDIRLIEPTNVFEGTRMRRSLMNPLNWWHLRQPSLPSWGEPYASIAERMLGVMDEAWTAAAEGTTDGDIVMVSHQAPIWITHLRVAGLPLQHDPRTRRCALSSVTSFERVGDVWREVAYAEPAATGDAVDVGAV